MATEGQDDTAPDDATRDDVGSGSPEEIDLHEVARRLGVHYMTAYRYVRTGVLPGVQRGNRWHVLASDVQRHANPSDDPVARPPARVTSPARLARRLVAGDEPGAWRILDFAIAAEPEAAPVVLDVLAPALHAVGEAWARGEIGIGEEHRATTVATRLVGRLGPRFSRRGLSRGTVVLACVEGERHALPVALVATVLRASGYDAIELGADTPSEEIARVSLDAGAQLRAVGLSATTADRRGALSDALEQVKASRPDTLLVAGGAAVRSADDARSLGADAWAGDARELVTVLESHGRRARRARRES